MKGRCRLWTAVLVGALAAGPFLDVSRVAAGDEATPPGYATVQSKPLVRGVVRYGVVQRGRRAVQVARLDPGAAVHVTAGLAHEQVRGAEAASSICARRACLLGVNGDFFNVQTREPSGGIAVDGVLVRSPAAGHPQLTITRDGRWTAGALGWEGRVEPVSVPAPPPGAEAPVTDPTQDPQPPDLPDPTPSPTPEPTPEPEPAQTVVLAGVNVAPVADGVVLYTPHWQATTGTGPEWSELTVGLAEAVRAEGTQDVSARAFGEGTGNASVPLDGAVLSGHGRGADALRRLWDRVQDGSVAGLRLVGDASVDDLATSIGGGPLVLRDGIYVAGDSSFAAHRHPRTLLGWDDAGRRWLVTVDGRQPRYSEGMTLHEAAEFMLGLGATDVLNLDGGGSTTFVEQGRVVNRPIHGGTPGRERPVVNALLAIATEPLTTPPPPPPRTPAPTPKPVAAAPPPPPTPAPTPEPTPTPTPLAIAPPGTGFGPPQDAPPRPGLLVLLGGLVATAAAGLSLRFRR